MFLSLKGSLNTKFPRFKGILDIYAGAAAAYSLRRLSKVASSVVRVRRSSDNDEKDFTAADVSSGAMTDWVGSAEWDDDASSDSTSNWETVDSTISHSVDKYVLTYTATTQWAILNTGPNLINNNPITISVDVKNGTSGNAAVYLGASNIGTGNQTLGQIGTTSDSWQTLTATFNATSSAFNKPSIRFDMTSGTVEFKNFSISQTGDGFVETWYDQSGNGNDATQGTAGSQPKIVDGGSLVADGLDFDGVNDRLFGSHILNTDDVLYAAVVAKNKDLSKRGLYVNNLFYNSSTDNGGFSVEAKTFNQAGNIVGWLDDTNVGASVQDGLSSLTQDQVQLLSFDLSNGSSKFHLDGSLVNTFSTSMNSEDAGSLLNIGNSTSGTVPLEGSIKEIIIYNSDQSANRAAIEANINNQYDIY